MADTSYIARRTRELAKSAGMSTQDVRSMLAKQVGASGSTPKALSQANQRKVANLLKKGSKVFVGKIRTERQQRDLVQKQARQERKAWGNYYNERDNVSLLKALQDPMIASRLGEEDLQRAVERGKEFKKEQQTYDETTQMTWEQYQEDPRFQRMNIEFDMAGINAFFDGYVEDFADVVYSGWRGSGSPLEPYIGFDLGAWM